MEEKLSKEKQSDIQAQFSDLKKHLSGVSRAEWEALPDARDLVKRSKKQREQAQTQRYVPVPDSVINSARIDGQTNTFIDPNSMMQSGMMSAMPGDVSVSNLTELGQARG